MAAACLGPAQWDQSLPVGVCTMCWNQTKGQNSSFTAFCSNCRFVYPLHPPKPDSSLAFPHSYDVCTCCWFMDTAWCSISYSIKIQTSGILFLLVPRELYFILFILYFKIPQQIEKHVRQAFMVMFYADPFSLPSFLVEAKITLLPLSSILTKMIHLL